MANTDDLFLVDASSARLTTHRGWDYWYSGILPGRGSELGHSEGQATICAKDDADVMRLTSLS